MSHVYINKAIILVYFKVISQSNIQPYIIFLKWGNVGGLNEKFGEEEKKRFEALRKAAGGEREILDWPSDLGLDTHMERANHAKFLINFGGGMTNFDYNKIKYMEPIPCSQQMRLFAYNDVREFNQPSFKRTYMSEKKEFIKSGYVDWVADRVSEISEYSTPKY